MKTNNIIFDLGGVIINIQVAKVFKEFCKKSKNNLSETEATIHSINTAFEIGAFDEIAFCESIRTRLNIPNISNSDIITLWNTILLDIPKDRIEILEQLKNRYRIFLLSNTNTTHLKGVNEILNSSSKYNNLSSIFEKCYFSFEIKMRKPDPKIYEKVLEENGLNPLETLFIDDTLENTISAATLGIKTIYLCHPLTLKEALREYV